MEVKAKKRVDNAYKRGKVSLVSVMIKINYKGMVIECESLDEAEKMVRFLEDKQRELPSLIPGARAAIRPTSPWTSKKFWEFMDRLGEPQKHILAILVKRGKASDEELRKALKLDGNQQLAGILSGLSKQAAGVDIPARSVFTIQNESKSGEVTKTYVVSELFFTAARNANWEHESMK